MIKKKKKKKKKTAVKQQPAIKASPSVGELIDRLYARDQAIDKIQAELREANRLREKTQVRLLKAMARNKLRSAKGTHGLAVIKTTPHPKIVKGYALWKYIISKKAYDLLQNRVASKAYFDRVEEGEKVPGVEVYTSTRISVTKAK